jgi:hypothetical protein
VTFVDPTERTFKAEVPACWRTVGGIARDAALTISPVLQTYAPDGSIFLQLGDRQIMDYITRAGPGFPIGSRYAVWLKYCVASRGLSIIVAEQSTKAFPPHCVTRLTTRRVKILERAFAPEMTYPQALSSIQPSSVVMLSVASSRCIIALQVDPRISHTASRLVIPQWG